MLQTGISAANVHHRVGECTTSHNLELLLTRVTVKPPIMPGWDGFDVVSYVQRSLPVHVLVDNDVNIMALGEQSAHWPEHNNFFFVKVATGIGSGIISNGELQRGANGTAGDLGHVQVARGADVLCACGNYG